MKILFVLILLVATKSYGAEIKIQTLSATIKDKTISDANVFIQKQGQATATGKTDGKGWAKVQTGIEDDAAATIIIKRDGYSNLVAKCPCNGMTYAMSPTLESLDSLRVVLNWGDEPQDLDSHLVYGDNHIHFDFRKKPDANLDVDDIDGFGPETITIQQRDGGLKYVYAVHDFTNRKNLKSMLMSNTSKAKVFVYVGNTLVRSYYVPELKPGTLWVVFGIGTGGDIFDINSMTSPTVYDRDKIKGILKDVMAGPSFSKPAPVVASAQAMAREFNKQGERAYHAKKIDESIELYQKAINTDPEYAQAYSNIGLSFQKANRAAEAIWANRKAIALASGSNARTVRASSYYNIARVYESQQKWALAKSNFEKALENKSHKAYTKGISRMEGKLK